ncbi:mechanosensitive ion channel [Blautia schinkii]|nr:mechanosensitive ion channel [Blautia schinkii]
MSERLKKKIFIMFAVEIICVVLLGVFLTVLQTDLSIKGQYKDTKEKIQQMQGIIDNADEASAQNTMSYDIVYQSKAETVAYMAKKETDFSYAASDMRQLADRMNVTNIFILDNEGKSLAGSGSTAADFTYDRFNQLRTVFEAGEPSEAFEVKIGDEQRRYYGAKIDEKTQAVIEQDPEELHQIQENTSSWKSILSKIGVGLEGFTFAVSNQDYTFLYHPNEELVGTDALSAGLNVEELEDDNYEWMEINGERYYAGVANIDDDHAYVICAVPEKEIMSSRNITVGIVLFIFFVVITVVIIYAILMMLYGEVNGSGSRDNYRLYKKMYFNKDVGRKVGSISLVGLIFILVASFYMQTLFSLSRYSMSNNQRAVEVQNTLKRNEEEIALITQQYNRRYLNKAQIAADILGQNPELQTREELQELSKALDVEYVLVFDKNGRVTATDSNYTNFELSQNPEDQSYEFNALLQGVEDVIQEAQPDEVSGEYHQYLGSVIYDEDHNINGFVQISVTPDMLKSALATTELSSVLKGVKAGVNGFAYAVNKEDQTFSYYPEDKLVGRSALEYGMQENQFRDEYCDYITVDGQRFYGSCLETDSDYIYVVIPDDEMTDNRLPVALATTGASLICLMVVFILLTFGVRTKEQKTERNVKKDGPMMDVIMPDGSVKKTESAESRWSNLTIKWAEKTPEQQIGSVLKALLSVLALAICAAVLFKDSFFDSNSIFLYVLNGKWERSVNVFAITGCIMIICVVSVAVMVLRKILQMLSRTFGARGETVCRLLSSFVKYISVIAILYYCFALFGVDTQTLLASAGILTLVIGLGAKELVSDILAGLFIIFEGEFRVGDIVTVGDWRGTVLEIGVRTTKIESSGNVKIISNSAVSGVINMTRRNSVVECEVGIEYGESLESVENVLRAELPKIKSRIPELKEGPYYKGVISIGAKSVRIKVIAYCSEVDRAQATRDLNREIKLLLDRNHINIP